MKFPQLVLPQFCQTPITVTVNQEGVSEDGEPLEAFRESLKCNYQEVSSDLIVMGSLILSS